MARITEEAVKALTQSGELSTVDVHMKEKLEQMRKEREVIGLEIKQLTSKNDDMKNAFAILLDKFQDFVNSAESSQEQMRSTIKRLSIEN